MKFSDLHLDDQLLEAISCMGFEHATPIQEKAIPIVLSGQDVIACAQTGTGKTAAFLLPILNDLIGKKETDIDTLIIVPTRELAVQIEQQIQGLSYFISVGSKAVYGGGGGKDWSEEKSILKNGTDIIVATPGKLMSHLKMGNVNFSKLKHLVLDEADRMLNMGFIDDINMIIKHLPKNRQTLMFSATMPNNIRNLAKQILTNPTEISLSISKPAKGVKQSAYLCYDKQKIDVLQHILSERNHYESILIFSSTKKKVSEIVHGLKKRNHKAFAVSSNLEQSEREEALRGFRSKRIRIVVATDVLSRGIDIKDINLVINFDVPRDAEDYVHRIGRTARANTNGESFTLINPNDMQKFHQIEKLIEMDVPKLELPESFGEAPPWKISFSKNKRHNTNNKKRYYSKKK